MYCFYIVHYFYIAMSIVYEVLTCSVSLFSNNLSNCAHVTVMNVK
jgi:hypothetical protein